MILAPFLKINSPLTYEFMSELSIWFHWSIHLSLWQYTTFSWLLLICSKYWNWEGIPYLFFHYTCFKIFWVAEVSIWILELSFTFFSNKLTGILIGIEWNLLIILYIMAILTILIILHLPVPKCGISFHLFRSYLIYFNSSFQFSAYKFCTYCLLKFVLYDFINLILF